MCGIAGFTTKNWSAPPERIRQATATLTGYYHGFKFGAARNGVSFGRHVNSQGREFFVGKSLTGADIQMSFVGEMAKVFDKLAPYPNLAAWLTRMHARPAFQRSVEKGGAYRFAK